jgi:transcriptional regulator with XRE-family HTH domain
MKATLKTYHYMHINGKITTMNHLKAFRKQHNLTQPAAAELLGYNVHTWRHYENGIRDTPKHVLRHIEHYNMIGVIK